MKIFKSFPRLSTASLMACVSFSLKAVSPLKMSEHGLEDVDAPPNSTSKFLFGSVPRQSSNSAHGYLCV